MILRVGHIVRRGGSIAGALCAQPAEVGPIEHGHSATVAILYDARGARIDYVDSNDLMHEQGPQGETIHKSYGRWVDNLAKDIGSHLGQAAPPTPAAH